MNMDVRPASLVHHDGKAIFYPGTFQDDLGGGFLTIQKPKKATIKLLMVVYDVIILYGF